MNEKNIIKSIGFTVAILFALSVLPIALILGNKKQSQENIVKVYATDFVDTVMPNRQLQFNAIINDVPATNAQFYLSDTKNATIDQDTGLLTVNADAIVGEQLSVFATLSNYQYQQKLITIVGIPLQSVKLSAPEIKQYNGDFEVDFGTNVTFDLQLDPIDASVSSVELQFLQGEQFVVRVSDFVIAFKESAINQTFKVKAVINGQIESNLIEFAVINDITVSLPYDRTQVLPGEQVKLSAKLANTILSDAEFFVKNYQNAKFVGDILIIDKGAKIGDQFEVYATKGDNAYRTLKLTVVKDMQYYFSLQTDTLDINDPQRKDLGVMLLDGDGYYVPKSDISVTIVEGQENLLLDSAGNFIPLGHGLAKVRIAYATFVTQVDVHVLVPPQSIVLSSQLQSWQQKAKTQFGWGHDFDLPFDFSFVNIPGTRPHLDFAVTVENGQSQVGEYDASNKKIIFDKNAKGRTIINVSSNTGSVLEATAKFELDLNLGNNVYDYQNFKSALEDETIDTVNLLSNLELSIAKSDDQTMLKQYLENRIFVRNQSKIINGNGYKLDFSKMSYMTPKSSGYGLINDADNNTFWYSALIVFDGGKEVTQLSLDGTGNGNTYQGPFIGDVVINDFEIYGNVGYINKTTNLPHQPTDKAEDGGLIEVSGSQNEGVFNGTYISSIVANFLSSFAMNNVKITNSGHAAVLRFINDATIDNSWFEDNFASDFRIKGTIFNLKDNYFGVSGGHSVYFERGGSKWWSPGTSFDGSEPNIQTITLLGGNMFANIHAETWHTSRLASGNPINTMMPKLVEVAVPNTVENYLQVREQVMENISYNDNSNKLNEFNLVFFSTFDEKPHLAFTTFNFDLPSNTLNSLVTGTNIKDKYLFYSRVMDLIALYSGVEGYLINSKFVA
ncbi:MAG: hypothetical protein LBU60_06795 [Clostridiales bacterium]|jgi:hypothetical protein|nr:hypothetical protein [Clostridiales bacterium]